VPIPRRFDRRPPERDTTRINDRIRVPQLRLIGEDGEQIGIVDRDEALNYARERDLDLVEIAPEANPPVCRVLDYSKYKYEQEQRRKAARKHQQQVTVREMKLRPKIATHDYETKKGHILRFLKEHNKVKVTIMFRGREVTHPERGESLLRKLATEIAEFGTIEQQPSQEGRNMTMVLAPVRSAQDGRKPERPADSAGEGAKDRGARAPRDAPREPDQPSAGEGAGGGEPSGTPDSSTEAQEPGPGTASSAPQPSEEPAPKPEQAAVQAKSAQRGD
jgi:translation initiation factor IF-3